MIKSGQQHLENLRDGRVVYIGDEKVEDVTTHPAFARAAEACEPDNVAVMAIALLSLIRGNAARNLGKLAHRPSQNAA